MGAMMGAIQGRHCTRTKALVLVVVAVGNLYLYYYFYSYAAFTRGNGGFRFSTSSMVLKSKVHEEHVDEEHDDDKNKNKTNSSTDKQSFYKNETLRTSSNSSVDVTLSPPPTKATTTTTTTTTLSTSKQLHAKNVTLASLENKQSFWNSSSKNNSSYPWNNRSSWLPFTTPSSSESPPPPPQQQQTPQQRPDATILVHLSGEMGNHLCKIAQAYSLHLLLVQDEYNNITTNIVTLPQFLKNGRIRGKSHATRNGLMQCFSKLTQGPETRHWWWWDTLEQQSGKKLSQSVARREQQLHDVWGNNDDDTTIYNNNNKNYSIEGMNRMLGATDMEEIKLGLSSLQQLVQSSKKAAPSASASASSSSSSISNDGHSKNTDNNNDIPSKLAAIMDLESKQAGQDKSLSIVLPFACPDWDWDGRFMVHINQHYHELRDLFSLNETLEECCKERAFPEETVLHFRNFVKELKVVGVQKGFEELSPHQIAFELLGELQSGDKVAITTRFNDDTVQAIVAALQSRGLMVRVITGQSGVQDFCFLKSAQKELIGMARSTFALWAAILGNAQRARLYLVDSPSVRASFNNGTWSDYHRKHTFQWTIPELQSRLVYETYQSEDAWQEQETTETNATTTTSTTATTPSAAPPSSYPSSSSSN